MIVTTTAMVPARAAMIPAESLILIAYQSTTACAPVDCLRVMNLLIRGATGWGSKFPAFLSKTKGQKVHARSKIIFRLTRSNGGGMGVWGKD